MSNHYLFIVGHNRVGKGTVADNIQKKLEHDGYRVYRIALADRLKRLTIDAAYHFLQKSAPYVNPSYPDFSGWLNVNKENVYRYLLQGFGEMARQYVAETFWLDRMLEDTPYSFTVPRIILVDDCRYPNESDWVRENGGLLVGVAGYNRDRYMHPYDSRMLLDVQYSQHHPSVQGVTYCMETAHAIVGNNGNMSQLREALRLQLFNHPEWKRFMDQVDADRKQSHTQNAQVSSESGTVREDDAAASAGSGAEPESASETGAS